MLFVLMYLAFCLVVGSVLAGKAIRDGVWCRFIHVMLVVVRGNAIKSTEHCTFYYYYVLCVVFFFIPLFYYFSNLVLPILSCGCAIHALQRCAGLGF